MVNQAVEPAPIIALVVEGTGEISAVPLLLRRLAHDMFGCWSARFLRPSRYGRGQLTTTGGIERIIERTVVLNPDATGVLVMLDADDDCPAALAPRLLDRARRARPDRRLSVVLRTPRGPHPTIGQCRARFPTQVDDHLAAETRPASAIVSLRTG